MPGGCEWEGLSGRAKQEHVCMWLTCRQDCRDQFQCKTEQSEKTDKVKKHATVEAMAQCGKDNQGRQMEMTQQLCESSSGKFTRSDDFPMIMTDASGLKTGISCRHASLRLRAYSLTV